MRQRFGKFKQKLKQVFCALDTLHKVLVPRRVMQNMDPFRRRMMHKLVSLEARNYDAHPRVMQWVEEATFGTEVTMKKLKDMGAHFREGPRYTIRTMNRTQD